MKPLPSLAALVRLPPATWGSDGCPAPKRGLLRLGIIVLGAVIGVALGVLSLLAAFLVVYFGAAQ